jgi:type IV secretion system protein VirB2
MIVAAAIQQASLADPPPVSAITAATDWISSTLFGPLATAVAIISVAWLGFAMLSGRIDIRRGLSVVLGCFLLFGARGIADGLWATAAGNGVSTAAAVPEPPNYSMPPRPANGANAFDPYAGASIVR